MESELAKTLRSMSDDHRMVPDFSEQLLDIADAIELQAKEISKHREHIGDLQGRLWSVKGTRDQARKDRDRKDRGWCEAVQKLSEVRADRNEAQGRIVKLEQERDAALAEVERLKGEVKWWKREAATGQDNVNFITKQQSDWR